MNIIYVYTLYRMFRKNCVFFRIVCNPSPVNISLKETFEVIKVMRVYSHSHILYKQKLVM